jgi:hypothetical protein
MKILALEKDVEGVNWNNQEKTLEDEARQVYQLYLAGNIREIYFNENNYAILVLECQSKENAVELLNSLPLVKKGMIQFEVMKMMPYTGYDRILSSVSKKTV